VLAAVSLPMFGNYYVFDALDPVGPLLTEGGGFTNEQLGLLDSAYNVAALLVLVAGGVAVDRFGARRALLGFAVVTAAGGAIIAAAPGFAVMAAGRFVLGTGAEPLIVAATTVLGRWFKGKELAFAMAVNLTVARLGSVAADNARTLFAPLFGSWRPPLVLAAAIGLTCIVGAIAYAALDRRPDVAVAPPDLPPPAERADGEPPDLPPPAERGEGRGEGLLRRFRFTTAYWWLVGLCVAFYSAVFPFRRFANVFFVDARGTTQEVAGFMNGLLPLSAMVATPLFGLLADRIGRRALLMVVGSALFAPTFLLMTSRALPLAASVGLMGIAFSLVPAVLWPAVTYVVDERRLGTAYALMTFCQQVGWAATSWLLGRANDVAGASAAHPDGYRPMMWILTALAAAGLACALALWRGERGHGLEAPPGAAPSV
jgi:MFS family permease